MIFKNYVMGLIYDDIGRVLLIKKNRPKHQVGKWNGVGGKIEEGENPLQAMTREIKEETNLDITKDQLVLVYACVCDGFYCETFGVKFKEIPNINLENLKQMEKHISPKFTKFNVNNFAIPSRFMEYNRGIIINSEDIIKTLKGE